MMKAETTGWRRRLLLAVCVCVSASGVAWGKDTYAYLYTSDYNFGVADLTTGGYSLCGNTGLLLAGLAVDSSGTIYGAAFNGNTFYTINPADGALTPVGNASINFWELGSTKHGVYALDSNYNLYSVNTATGAVTEIGPTGLSTNHSVGLSTGSGKLYLEYNSTLYKVSTRKGTASMIGTGANGIGGMLFAKHVLYGGGAADPLVIWSINTGNGAQSQVSTIQNETGTTWGLAPTPKGATGTCPS